MTKEPYIGYIEPCLRRKVVSFSGPKTSLRFLAAMVTAILLAGMCVYALTANAGEGKCNQIRRVYLESSDLPPYAEVAKCRDMGQNVL